MRGCTENTTGIGNKPLGPHVCKRCRPVKPNHSSLRQHHPNTNNHHKQINTTRHSYSIVCNGGNRRNLPTIIIQNYYRRHHPLPAEPGRAISIFLSRLPTTHKIIPSRLVGPFLNAADRCAKAFLEDQSEESLLQFLALPKIGLQPALTHSAKVHLNRYPNVEWCKPSAHRATGGDTLKTVNKLVTQGRLSAARKVLKRPANQAGPSNTATDELLKEMQQLHPPGPMNAFPQGEGPSAMKTPTAELIKSAILSMDLETAPGVSGWTAGMLRLASHRQSVMDMLVKLSAGIVGNVAPGREMLTASRLIAIPKPGTTKHRPIAIGDIIYRVLMKAILRQVNPSIHLESFQLGVGSKGGVEPIVRAIMRAAAGSLLAHNKQRFTHLVRWMQQTPSTRSTGEQFRAAWHHLPNQFTGQQHGRTASPRTSSSVTESSSRHKVSDRGTLLAPCCSLSE